MKNILKERPDYKLRTRTLASVSFVSDKDIQNKSVLDIGCGYGWCEVNFLARKVKKIIGIELSLEDLYTAKKYIKDKRASFVVGSAISLPFKKASFDTVVCWEVIEHIPKRTEDNMFKEIYRVLKPNGDFYLSTPYNSFPSKLLDPAWWLIGHRHYSTDKLVSLGIRTGFCVINMKKYGKWWNIISIVNMYISKWFFRRKPFLEQYFNEREDKEYATSDGFAGIFLHFRK